MELVAMLFGVLITLIAVGLSALLNRFSHKGKVFPTCYRCEKPMIQLQHLGGLLPYQIQHYLNKYNLPKHVVRRFICPNNHRELWIAPPVGDQRKSVMVSHEL